MPLQDSRWTLRRILQRAAEVVRTEGIRNLWFKILGETVYRRVLLFERPLNEPLPEIAARVPLDIGLLRETDIEEYLRFRPEADLSDLRRRLETGHCCFVARHQGCIVQAGWVATQWAWVEYLACEMQLAQDEIYGGYDALTLPGFRSQNIVSVVTTRMCAYFRDAGYRRQIGVVVPENRPALRSAEKTGFIRCGVMGYVKLGRWRWDFCRVNPNARPPGAPLTIPHSAHWDGVAQRFSKNAHYLDTFLGALKRRAHLELIQRWGGVPATGRVLKTDLFEEAMGPDAFLTELSGQERVVIGMDVSAAVARQAQSRDVGRQIQYVATDTRRLAFADNSFALIVS
ncbi:MAG: methyltransferase domain-containing protein, partial [Candidatus Binatia bacterium]